MTGHAVDENDVRNGLDDRNVPVGAFTNGYWLGADQLGRDLLVRAAYGARTSLVIGFTATVVAIIVGTAAPASPPASSAAGSTTASRA